MRKIIPLILLSIFLAGYALSQEEKREDPNKLFYVGNSYYEKRDYEKAITEYRKALDLGYASGNLYFNLGNAFFKTGKTGYAILYYEKAKRMMPQDRDLKANLDYAKSLIGSSSFQIPEKNFIISAVKAPFKDFNLNAIAIAALIFYLITIGMSVLFIVNPFFAKKIRLLFLVFLAVLVVNSTAFIIRYYDEEVLKRAIVVQKEADCRYEPIDKSTTYYKLQEGEEAILMKERNDWCQIKRLDDRIAWVKKEALVEI